MHRPSFSVIVPTYQRKALILRCLHDLGLLKYAGDWEVVVIVDGSTDGTSAALAELECPFALNVIEQPNRGLAAAKNRGAGAARNDVLLFLDDDMSFRPDILEDYARVFAAGADAACGDIVLSPDLLGGFITDEMTEWLAMRSRALRADSPLSPFFVSGGNLAVRRGAFEQVGGFDPQYTQGGGYGCDDVDLGIRLLAAGSDLRSCPEAVVSETYDIGPRRFSERTSRCAAAELRFVRKHPAFAGEIMAMRKSGVRRSKVLVAQLARFAFVARLASAAAAWLSENRDRLPSWASRRVPLFFWRANNLAYWSAMRRLGGFPASHEVLALCYHAIADLGDDPVMGEYAVSRAEFERQIDDLLARGFTFVSPDEVSALLTGSARMPRRAVLLTFDDCYVELTEVARDVLAPRGVPALAFAVAAKVGGTNEWDQPKGARRLRLLDGAGLQDLARLGVEIGCHSLSHAALPDVPLERLEAETAGAGAELSTICGSPPRFFAYPFGAVDAASRDAVRRANYEAAFGIERGRITPASDRFALPRVCIVTVHRGWRFRVATAFPVLFSQIEDELLRVRIQLRLLPGRIRRLAKGVSAA